MSWKRLVLLDLQVPQAFQDQLDLQVRLDLAAKPDQLERVGLLGPLAPRGLRASRASTERKARPGPRAPRVRPVQLDLQTGTSNAQES